MQDRTGYIGGTDAKRILDGDWYILYEEKLGIRQPEDLTHKFNVQLGIYTESFHADWLHTYHQLDVAEPTNEQVSHAQYPYMRARIDRWLDCKQTFLELKHTNERATPDSLLEWYLPQLAHYCNVMGVNSCWLSAITGNQEPQPFEVRPSREYREELLGHMIRFWWHVENKVPPEIIPKNALHRTRNKLSDTQLNGMRVVDMTGSNEWATHAQTWLDTKDAHAAHEAAKKGIKEMVPDNARIATGYGVTVKRSRANALLISEANKEAAE